MVRCLLCIGKNGIDLGLITSLASEFTEVNVPLSDSTSLSVKTHLTRKL